MQQFHTGPKAEWEGTIVLRASKIKSSTNMTNTQRPHVNYIFAKLMIMISDTYRCKVRIPKSKTRQEIIIFNHIYMSIWSILLCNFDAWNCPSRRHVPEEDR